MSLIAKQQVTPVVSVVGDQFEAGNTSTRRLWTTRYQKRRYHIDHAPLNELEHRSLRSFISQRDGQYDSFWYRDNVLRGGNVQVRFGGPISVTKDKNMVGVSVMLEETTAVQALTELDEVTAAAGVAPIAWYDASRQRYREHLGVAYYEDPIHDYAGGNYPLVGQGFQPTQPLSNKFSQRQYWRADGAYWGKTGVNVSSAVISGTQPALTWFMICRHKPASNTYCLVSVGSAASGGAFGIGMQSTGSRYGVWSGAALVTDGSSPSRVDDNWISLAAGVDVSSDSVAFWKNGALAENLTVTRTHAAGPVSFLASADGSGVANIEGDSIHDIQHALLFTTKLTTPQVVALHNLLAFQTGMATV